MLGHGRGLAAETDLMSNSCLRWHEEPILSVLGPQFTVVNAHSMGNLEVFGFTSQGPAKNSTSPNARPNLPTHLEISTESVCTVFDFLTFSSRAHDRC